MSIRPHGVDAVLRQRGFLLVGRGDYTKTVAPACMQPTKIMSGSGGCTPDWDKDFYTLMGKNSFRKMLRFMQAHPDAISEDRLCRELDQPYPKISKRLTYLSKCELIEKQGDNRWHLKEVPDNFGATFERYVKSVFEREFQASAEWGVKLKDFAYGDLDVLASLDSALCYVECKTTPPKDLDAGELGYFLQRCEDLAPEIAVLLIDTEDSLEPLIKRLDDIIVPLIRKEPTMADWKPQKPRFEQPSRFEGIYFGQRRIFITNAKPNVTKNLRLCLRFYSTWVKFQSFLGGPRHNYVTGEVFPL